MSGLFGPQQKCGVVGKEMFATKEMAQDALAAFGRRKGCKRTHWCVFCGHYHMTKGSRRRKMRGSR